VTTFSRADGFVAIDRHRESVPAGELVDVQLLSDQLRLADLVVTGSHCVGLDYLLDELNRRGVSSKVMSIGSMGGLAAAQRGQCDLAGVHLLDEATGEYNRPLLTPDLALTRGYRRLQGIVFRSDDERFAGHNAEEIGARLRGGLDCVMIGRNRGSGTRVLIDQLLGDGRPDGYANQPRSHNAVAAAVAQGRADWGVAIENVARRYGLGFAALQPEEYDFVVPRSRLERPAVRAFCELLTDARIRDGLRALGFEPHDYEPHGFEP
ncbi:MAG: hypothetical protein KDA63_17025, partial [Planctomycetales bacterium]|nr:hypothetical protein [Planctomycetales bacterium]